MNAYNEIYQEIKDVLAPPAQAPAPAPKPAPPPVSAAQTPAQLGWESFCFQGAGVQDKAETLKDTLVLDSGSSIDLMCNP